MREPSHHISLEPEDQCYMFRMQSKKSKDIRVFVTIKLPLRVMNIVFLGLKKAECQKIDAFELWCWRRLLKVPWTARRSNQSILKEISPGCSLEGLMLKLKLHYFGHLM